MDSDGDGQISAQRIDITQIQPDLLVVMTPLFNEMEELGQNLDEEEFIDAVCRLYDVVSIPDKNILISNKDKWDNNRSKIDSNRGSFKPQLN